MCTQVQCTLVSSQKNKEQSLSIQSLKIQLFLFFYLSHWELQSINSHSRIYFLNFISCDLMLPSACQLMDGGVVMLTNSAEVHWKTQKALQHSAQNHILSLAKQVATII